MKINYNNLIKIVYKLLTDLSLKTFNPFSYKMSKRPLHYTDYALRYQPRIKRQAEEAKKFFKKIRIDNNLTSDVSFKIGILRNFMPSQQKIKLKSFICKKF